MNYTREKFEAERIEVPTRAVVGYLHTPEGTVILGLRTKVSNGLGTDLISGIGGKVGDEPGLEDETDEEALVREIKEEIGVEAVSFRKVSEIIFIFPAKPDWNQVVVGYIVDQWYGDPVETDVMRPSEHRVDQLPKEQMWDDNQYWVPRILNGETIIGKIVYEDDNKTVADIWLEEASF